MSIPSSRLVIGLLLVALCAGCTTVPVTGRRSFALLPESQLAQMSLTSYQELLDESKLSNDRVKVQSVRRVGQRLARATESYLQANGIAHAPFDWEFNVIQDDEVANAFAMPGGKIAVYTGLFPVALDDTGLAVVMSHEIAHVLARHGNERMSQAMVAQFGQKALSVAVSEQPSITQTIFMTSYGAAAQMGLMLPYSRMHESEADRIGIVLMAMAGYDPQASIAFWDRMSKDGGERPPQLLSTHPDPARRVKQLKTHMPEALNVYNNRS